MPRLDSVWTVIYIFRHKLLAANSSEGRRTPDWLRNTSFRLVPFIPGVSASGAVVELSPSGPATGRPEERRRLASQERLRIKRPPGIPAA